MYKHALIKMKFKVASHVAIQKKKNLVRLGVIPPELASLLGSSKPVKQVQRKRKTSGARLFSA